MLRLMPAVIAIIVEMIWYSRNTKHDNLYLGSAATLALVVPTLPCHTGQSAQGYLALRPPRGPNALPLSAVPFCPQTFSCTYSQFIHIIDADFLHCFPPVLLMP